MNAKMKLVSNMPIRERDEWDAALQEMMDDGVRRGQFETLGINRDGQMVYRRTQARRCRMKEEG
jgi:hypothetical protein